MQKYFCALCRKLHLHLWICDMCRFVKCAFAELCTVQKVAFAEKCALQICAFCAQTVFAHLQICEFVFCTCSEKFSSREKVFFEFCAFVKIIFRCVRICEFSFFLFSTEFAIWAKSVKMSKKSKFPKMSENVPKKAHVFLSGTRVVPGPTRLTTQGGKSRQNMH